MGYLITAVLALLVGLILWAIQRERLSLIYKIDPSEIFSRDNISEILIGCWLQNAGNRPIENISYKFHVSDGKIESVRFTNPNLIQLSPHDHNVIEGIVSLLNPKEELGAIVTISDASQQSSAKLEARAVGATAREKSSEFIPEYLYIIMIAIAIGVAASTGFSMWTSYNQSEVNRSVEKIGNFGKITKEIEESKKAFEELKKKNAEYQKKLEKDRLELERGLPDREFKIFAILNKTGLGTLMPTLLATGDELPYWKTGLYIMHIYLTDKKNAKRYVGALDQLSNVGEITPASKGFLLYLAGKIEQDQGDSKKAIEYMEKCKKEAPLMYDHLMAQDPAYDLRALESVVAGAMTNKHIKPTR